MFVLVWNVGVLEYQCPVLYHRKLVFEMLRKHGVLLTFLIPVYSDTFAVYGVTMATRPKVLALDLDDTTLFDAHPALGKPIDGIIQQLEVLKAMGWLITIWTVRNESKEIAEHLKKLGVPFDYINENPFGPSGGSRKIYADVYLDDRALNFDGETKGLAEKINSFKPWHGHNPVSGK